MLVVPKLLFVVPKDLRRKLSTLDEHISNVYDRNEILLLTWMNDLFEKGKEKNQ